MLATRCFDRTRLRPDRRRNTDEWFQRVISSPKRDVFQSNGRVSR